MKHYRVFHCMAVLFLFVVSGCAASDDLLCFGGQRNRSHFKLIADPRLGYMFAPDFVWDIRVFKDHDEFLRMTAALRAQNPKTILGSYASACTTLPAGKDTYPPAKLPFEQCKPEWLLRDKEGKTVAYGKDEDRFFLDMRQPAVRDAVIGLAVARARYNGLDALCFDNCYWATQPAPNFPVSAAEWTDAFSKFYQEAGKAAKEAKLRCVVNVATTADKIADAFRAIAPFADGLMTEMAFHPNMRSPENLAKELKAYEDALKQGKIVLLIPRYKEDEKFALTQIQPLARQYGKIYVTAAGPVHDEPLYHRPRSSMFNP
jgi:hypothetical protein